MNVVIFKFVECGRESVWLCIDLIGLGIKQKM